MRLLQQGLPHLDLHLSSQQIGQFRRYGQEMADWNQRINLTAIVDPGLPLATLTSTYHEITINRQGTGYQVRLADGFVSMDRDFELAWQPAPSASPQAAVFTEVVDGETYALAMVMPPQEKGKGPELKREVVFIIDVSGSMSGGSIVQARAALHMAMGTLKREDRFNIIKFSNDATALFSTAQLADGAYLQDAKRFIDCRVDYDGDTCWRSGRLCGHLRSGRRDEHR